MTSDVQINQMSATMTSVEKLSKPMTKSANAHAAMASAPRIHFEGKTFVGGGPSG
jgi:hypothetical protein